MGHVFMTQVLGGKMRKIWPPERQQQVNETSDYMHRWARYTAWQLLRYALMESYGLEMEDLHFTLENGKWTCEECYISITHSGKLVAVAVGMEPVGVDLQKWQTVNPELADKILTPTQMEDYESLRCTAKNQYLLDRWCEKECIFKCGFFNRFNY